MLTVWTQSLLFQCCIICMPLSPWAFLLWHQLCSSWNLPIPTPAPCWFSSFIKPRFLLGRDRKLGSGPRVLSATKRSTSVLSVDKSILTKNQSLTWLFPDLKLLLFCSLVMIITKSLRQKSTGSTIANRTEVNNLWTQYVWYYRLGDFRSAWSFKY